MKTEGRAPPYSFKDALIMPRAGLVDFNVDDWRAWLQRGARFLADRDASPVRAFAPITLSGDRGEEVEQLFNAARRLPRPAQDRLRAATAQVLETLVRRDGADVIRTVALFAARIDPPRITAALHGLLSRRLGFSGLARERVAVALAELIIARTTTTESLQIARRLRECDGATAASSAMLLSRVLVDEEISLRHALAEIEPGLVTQLDPASIQRRFLADQLVTRLGVNGCAWRVFREDGGPSAFIRETLEIHRLTFRELDGALVATDLLTGERHELTWVPASGVAANKMSLIVANERFLDGAIDPANDPDEVYDARDAEESMFDESGRWEVGS